MPTPFASARHQAALSTPTGTRRYTRVTASRGGQSRELEPVSGTLTQDVRRGGRWDGKLTFAGDELIPRRPSDLLTPFGTQVEVELGMYLLDGSLSTVPYGVYEITSAKTRISAGERVVDVSLADLSGQVERYRFEQPLTIANGTDLAAMINAVVTSRVGVNPNVSATGATLGAARTFGLDTGTGPWDELLDVLAGFSRVAWFNRTGQINVANLIPDAATAYPFDLMTSLSADFDTLPPNVVVVSGEAQDGTPPVWAIAMDDDPSSPTYAGTGPGTSPYGRVTRYFSSPLIKTVPQAQSAADTILASLVGAGATYTLMRPYDPTVDAGDVVSVNGEPLAVDAVSLSLGGETSFQVREL